MKLLPKVALAMLALALSGCSTARTGETMAPALSLRANHRNLTTGEITTVMAETANLAGNATIHWRVSPSTASIEPLANTAGTEANFTAREPGTYIVKAWATRPDGTNVSDETQIVVNGPMPASNGPGNAVPNPSAYPNDNPNANPNPYNQPAPR